VRPELQFLKDLIGGTAGAAGGDEIFTNLVDFEFSPDEITPAVRKLVAQIAARGVKEFFDFCIPAGVPLDENATRTAIRRFFAVAWLLHSEMLLSPETKPDGRQVPMTLDKLSKLPQLECTRCNLSVQAQKFGKQFGFRTRVQKRENSRPNYAESARLGWIKRRQAGAPASEPPPEHGTGSPG
jgi:hypothetical protein